MKSQILVLICNVNLMMGCGLIPIIYMILTTLSDKIVYYDTEIRKFCDPSKAPNGSKCEILKTQQNFFKSFGHLFGKPSSSYFKFNILLTNQVDPQHIHDTGNLIGIYLARIYQFLAPCCSNFHTVFSSASWIHTIISQNILRESPILFVMSY